MPGPHRIEDGRRPNRALALVPISDEEEAADLDWMMARSSAPQPCPVCEGDELVLVWQSEMSPEDAAFTSGTSLCLACVWGLPVRDDLPFRTDQPRGAA